MERVKPLEFNPLFKAKIAYGELGLEEQQKREAAINDVQTWMGEERFELLVQTIQTPSVHKNRLSHRSPKNLRMIMAFMCAFEGYPATAMLKRYHPRYVRLFGVDGRGRNVVPIR